MKYYLLIFLSLFSFLRAHAMKAEYDERVELISVLCNLADFEEYNMGLGAAYDKAVADYFAPYREHAAVNMFKRLHYTNGIGYNAPIDFALNLKKVGSHYQLQSYKIGDERWNNLDLDAVCDTISMFYNDTDFGKFFKSQEPFYSQTCNRFTDKVLSLINEKWYPEFYGTAPNETFNVVIGFLTGGCNYGPTVEIPNRPRDVYAVLGYVVQPDSTVMFDENPEYYRNLLVHEFNHSFVNPLLSLNEIFYEKMSVPAEKLFDRTSTIMSIQSYSTWDCVINESVVRAAVACYFLDNGTANDVRNSINEELKVGFYWMPQLVNKMNYYRNHRDTYPTFASYYPEIISFFEEITAATDNEIQTIFMN